MKEIKKIIIATGGTGGHVFPALSLSSCLKKNFEVKLISDQRGMRYFKNKEKIKIINTGTIFQKNLFKAILNFCKIIYSTIKSFFYLKKIKPQIVFGMGGYSSFPVCAASYILKIPIIIYENNLVLGRTNRVLLPFAKRLLLSTKDIRGIKKKYEHKTFFSGYLLRDEIFGLKKNINFKSNKELSVLVMGGSQSAKIFGEKIPKIIIKCNNKNIKLRVYQQCLENQMDEIKKIYTENQVSFKLFSFSEKLSDHYEATDIAITRSGASSIAELINLRIPFIAIPLPSAADNHQFENAFNFQKKGYCLLLDEKFINTKLFEILEDLNNNREKLLLFKNKMNEHSDKDSVSKVGEFIKKYLDEKN
tara:strand:+ start:3387 stop:4472 length:1086 start_codon:yes stop_codon:yes gene_type:complete